MRCRWILNKGRSLMFVFIFAFSLNQKSFANSPKASQTSSSVQLANTKSSNTNVTVSKRRIAELQAKMNQHQQIKVQFEQITFKSLRNHKRKTSGKAYFAKPGLFSWQLQSGDKWSFNGTFLYRYQSVEKQWLPFNPKQEKARELRKIVDLVLNVNQLFKTYSVQASKERNGKMFVSLKPNRVGEIKLADLTFDLKYNFVERLKLHFRGKNYTEIRFINPSFEKFDFAVFSPPPGAKVSRLIYK